MERLVTNFLRFVAGRDGERAVDIHVNRIAMGSSHDRALRAFKAEQAKLASRQDGAIFASTRAAK